MNQLKVYAKAIAAAVAGVIANAVVNMVNGTTPVPHTGGEWLQLALTTLGPALAVLLQPAKISQTQIDKDPTVIRVKERPSVVSDSSINVYPGGGGAGGGGASANYGPYRNPYKPES